MSILIYVNYMRVVKVPGAVIWALELQKGTSEAQLLQAVIHDAAQALEGSRLLKDFEVGTTETWSLEEGDGIKK